MQLTRLVDSKISNPCRVLPPVAVQPANGLGSNWFQWFDFLSGGAWFGG